MKGWKRVAAREWLIFIACLLAGGVTCFFTTYNIQYYHYVKPQPNADVRDFAYNPFPQEPDSRAKSLLYSYGHFQDEDFGFKHLSTAAWWFVPYVALVLLRSIWWAIRVLRS